MARQSCILHVEDNETNRYVMRHFLKKLDIRLVEAVTGEEAIELAPRERPDLVLLDIRLPGIQGYEVLERLRALPETRDLPVVAVSSGAFEQDIRRARAAGFDDYIVKPVNLQKLHALIRHYLDLPMPSKP